MTSVPAIHINSLRFISVTLAELIFTFELGVA